MFVSAKELTRGWGPKENEELKEWRGREPDGDGARGTANPVGGVAAMADSVPYFLNFATRELSQALF